MKKKYISICFFSIFLLALILIINNTKHREHNTDYTESIEVVNSTIFNDNHYLKIITNSAVSEDKKDLSRKLIRMYMDNSFPGFKISFDKDNYPKNVEISVYLDYETLKKGEELFQFDFSIPKEKSADQEQ